MVTLLAVVLTGAAFFALSLARFRRSVAVA
jgi:hypothetical protein